ncbi:MAG: 2'-5' RNA ligase family protein, partial [Lachnospira sp.]|nr:2'-5' RNA ligase family protein [Lachnospira sp.]
DEITELRLGQIMKSVAVKTGNTFMTDNNVPPHITVSAINIDDEQLDEIVEAMDREIITMKSGEVYFATVGQFMPKVIYVAPVLNQYLHNMAECVYETVNLEGVSVSKYYRPFQWMPHVTIAKTLEKEQMKKAFDEMQNTWGAFSGKVTKIGLAKTNPYREIKLWQF